MRRFRIPVVGLTVFLGLSMSFAADESYRLAGSILTDDHGVTLALVEKLDGTQQLLREGDSIDGGTVVEITSNTVRLRFESEELVLKLAGTDDRDAVMSMQYRQEDYADTETKSVGMEALAGISNLAQTTETTESGKRASRVLSYLDLPADARIRAVNDQPVESPDEALQMIAANIDENPDQVAGLLFKISIAANGRNQRVYVFADESGQIDDQAIRAN